MTRAEEIMDEFNSNALIGEEDGAICMIEDVIDPDGRIYRMEYQSTPDGKKATAWCRQNPWGSVNGDMGYTTGHVAPNGFICLGKRHSSQALEDSAYDLTFAISRARYWCTAFSALKESGTFPNP